MFDGLAAVAATKWNGESPQVIHGDVGGNVLFADASGLPPAIIDVSPYFRPRSFAHAILVADAVAWEHAPRTFAERFLGTGDSRAALLSRAVMFRLAAAVELWGAASARAEAELDAYRPILSLLDLA